MTITVTVTTAVMNQEQGHVQTQGKICHDQILPNTAVFTKCAHQAPVVQRADNFIQWIRRYPGEQMYSKECFWQVSHTISYLNLTYASTTFTNNRQIGKILHTFYLLDSDLSSG